ncbi:asparaginase [Prauserella cavernicola]|uniref:asparaginase n=1 Tax=Prauserella cavernicola TaxID=2800127 RepID=A0A934QVY2_9PSEU|nr:asparaginase [Prauserella cavernicola]MBK1787560.1 asparaginase [Prauserella cavernicola]
MSSRRSIALIATGGTISVAPPTADAQRHDGAGALTPHADASPEGIDVVPRDALSSSSRRMTPGDLWTLATAVTEEIAHGRDGVVVTHGTDTLEETVYALGLLVDTRVPVVLTGAMRSPHLAGPDGPANVRAALVAAADPALARYGPTVVFQDEVHVARLVTKLHSTRVAAFGSPAAGPVGFVAEDRLELLLGPPPGTDLLARTGPPRTRVGLLHAATGIDGSAAGTIASDVDALVVAALGAGHVSPSLGEALVRIADAGKPVVITSRCPDGALLSHTYGGAGSETELRRAGLHFAGMLSAPKARLRTLFGLSAGIPAGDLFPASARPAR